MSGETRGLCRHDRYQVVVAQLGADGAFTVEACDQPATYIAVMAGDGEGLSVRIDVDVCTDHNNLLADEDPGWRRSIKRRPRP
jgi:hypothetical protein